MTLPRLLAPLLVAAAVIGLPPAPAAAFPVEVTVAAAAAGQPVNRLILGNNVQWVDRGDDLLQADGRFDPALLAAAQALAPSVLRYPGGSHTDLYHWRDGVGDPAQRGQNSHFYSKVMQPVAFGTDEFLELCAIVGAEPMLSVNMATGTAVEAAAWVAAVNGPARSRNGRRLPRVQYWELGNEPYLRDEQRPELAVAPQTVAERARAFIAAMRAADPSITIGLPLRSDRIGGVPATPFPGFNDTLLAGVPGGFDFVALHNAYAPFAVDGRYAEQALYLATMAAPLQVAEDFALTQAAVRRHQGRSVKLAVTEYNALYSIGQSTDRLIASVAGAILVADLLRLYATTPDLLTAEFWSLSGNWFFGAVAQNGAKRPAFQVLSAYSRALHGKILPVSVAAPLLTTPRAGFVAARSDVPAVTALAVRDGATLTLLLVNKHPGEAATLSLQPRGASPTSATFETLGAEGLFAGQDGQEIAWRPAQVLLDAGTIGLTLPAHTVGVLTATLVKPP